MSNHKEKAKKSQDNHQTCPITISVNIIGGKWKIPILYTLREETLRFSEIQKVLNKVTQKMLTQQLRELERDGLISRKVYAQVPPKVEYSITPMGRKLEPILDSLCNWGKEYKEYINSKDTNSEDAA